MVYTWAALHTFTINSTGKFRRHTSSMLYYTARMGEGTGAYRVLVGRPEGRRPLGRSRRRWEDNIKMDLQEVGWGAWTGLIWLRIGTGGGLL
jgi:hypothetical protein